MCIDILTDPYSTASKRSGTNILQEYHRRVGCTIVLRFNCLDRVWICHSRMYVSCILASRVSVSHTAALDGGARIGATLFAELLNAVFANVGQRAVRTVARETFEHLLNLDMRFHLNRQTGGLTRAIDRGTK